LGAYIVLIGLAGLLLGARVPWRAPALTAAALLPILVLTALGELASTRFPYPFGGWGNIAWAFGEQPARLRI
jgi:hypothetical protein